MTFREEWGGFTGVFGGRVVAELAAAVTRAPNADEYLAGLVPASSTRSSPQPWTWVPRR